MPVVISMNDVSKPGHRIIPLLIRYILIIVSIVSKGIPYEYTIIFLCTRCIELNVFEKFINNNVANRFLTLLILVFVR